MAKKGKKCSFEKRLKVYSAAAAGVLALAPSADAAIHYSGIQNLPVDSSHTQDIDLNGDSNTEFIFRYSAFGNTHKILDYQSHGAQVIGGFSDGRVSRLSSNYEIKGTLGFGLSWYIHPLLNLIRSSNYGGYSSYGNFNNATGFLGVRFHTNACQGSNWNYGWIQYHGNTPASFSSPVSGTIIDWAYEDSCNTPIAAGAEGVKTTSVPALNQWGMIVFMSLLGGLAARMLRKREEENS
jgi:hypothetical protein